MYKNTYDREAYLYIDERLREEAHRQLIREATTGRKPAYAPLLAALGRMLTRTGARLQAQSEAAQPAADRGEALSAS